MAEICEFTTVNDHFSDKHNAEVGLSKQLISTNELPHHKPLPLLP